MAQHSAGDVKREMLDDVVAEDTVDAAWRYRPGPGQVEVHLRPPHDVGVDPLLEAHIARPDVHPDRRGHRRYRPLESPGQQRSAHRGERVVDHRPCGFRDLSTHADIPFLTAPVMDETSHRWTPYQACRITGVPRRFSPAGLSCRKRSPRRTR